MSFAEAMNWVILCFVFVSYLFLVLTKRRWETNDVLLVFISVLSLFALLIANYTIYYSCNSDSVI